MKKVLVAGLCMGIIGCSPARTNVLISKSEISGVFGGVTERYNPTIVTAENEYEKAIGLNPLLSVFYGRYREDYEAGFDIGLKYNADDLYFKSGIGTGYESKKFEKQLTRINIHVKIGLGFERQIKEHRISMGAVFDHRSNGNSFLKNFGIDVNNEPNNGVNTVGYEVGFSF
ncbi:MAG: acyloxyacyl hydrolase [Nanoarchaeota archaeon]